MLLWTISFTLLIPVLARPKGQEEEKAALNISIKCPESRLSYFMTVRVEPLASAVYKADEVEESKCREWCSRNKSPADKSINCSSYSYNDETRRCKLYAEQTYPDGALERRVTSKPKRFFEKYCMPEKLIKCAKMDFMRVDEMLLSGFAQSTAVFRTLPECMNHCIEEKEFNCKSAMYFYEEGECILNLETITSNNTLIHVEDDDRVVFLQNDCFMQLEEKKEQLKSSKQKSIDSLKLSTSEKPMTKTTQKSTTTSQEPMTESTTVSLEPTTEESPEPTMESTTIPPPTTPEPILPSTIKTTKLIEPSFSDEEPHMKNVDEKEEASPAKKAEEEMDTRMPERPIARRPDMQEEIVEKKIKEVELGFMNSGERTQEASENKEDEAKPQLYGAKILEPEVTGIIEPIEEILTQKEFNPPKSPKESTPEATKVVKTNNVLNEFQLASAPAPNIVPEENKYFSTWSTWTSCSSIGERRVRKRKCLDFKKCKGRLMQIDYCPAELVLQEEEPVEQQPDNDAFARGPVGPIRQPLPVAKGDAEAGSPPSILPPQLPQKHSEVLPEGAPGSADDVWSPWLGVCQHFVSTQPCKNNQAIGFESRECIAKDPKNCHGPFFRYCTLPCE